MELNNLFELYVSTGQKLDALWQFFVSIHIAIFGGLFYFHKMKNHQIAISFIAYVAFSLINIRAKIYEYKFYDSLIHEIKTKDITALKYLDRFFSQYAVDDRIIITILVHILSFICLCYLLYMSKENRKKIKT